MKSVASSDRVAFLFNYNPRTGEFIRRTNKGPHEKAGFVAGCTDSDGYVKIKIDGRNYKAHQLAWFVMNGVWPAEIDHINGNKADNSIGNLREVTRSQNQQNIGGARVHNKCGLLGASFNAALGKFHSQIQVDKKKIHLGFFDTALLAHEAYLTAKSELHPFRARI